MKYYFIFCLIDARKGIGLRSVRIFPLKVWAASLLLSLRLPSARIEAAAGSSVGCGRFSIVCPAATLPIEGKAARGLLSWPWPLLLSPMERGASTLEERKFKYKNRIFFPAVAVRIFFPLKEERPLFLFRSLFLPVIRVKPKLYLFFLFFYFVIRYYS